MIVGKPAVLLDAIQDGVVLDPYQPESALTQWFNQRTQGTGPNRRARRIAIVAVARRLAIALWRYLKDGVIPEGARLKPV
jgi:transposase